MKPLNEIYKSSFFKQRHKLNWRASYVVSAINKEFHPESVVDVGCATGDLVKEWLKQGVFAYGIEGSKEALIFKEVDIIKVHDLRNRLPHDTVSTELVTCLEVVEHIEPEYETVLCDNLRKLAEKFLVITAAPPGQGGHHHVNCLPKDHWVNVFTQKGFIHLPSSEDRIKDAWEPYKKKPGIKAFYDNLICFRRR